MATTAHKPGSSRSRDCGCGSGSGRSVSVGTYSVPSSRNGGFVFGVLERPRYYPRQLMTPDDLNLEAAYFRDKMRRHNLFLHGWGVVCGALVCAVPAQPKKLAMAEDYRRRRSVLRDALTDVQQESGPEPWLVRIQPGYIIGPYGDEIMIDQPIDVSLQGNGTSSCGSDSSDDAIDPWCSEVYTARREGPVYVAVKYRECLTRTVPGSPGGCDCAEEPCEFSRYRDGFEVGLLECCPDSHLEEPNGEPSFGGRKSLNPVCPECADDPWVVLAKVEVDGKGVVTVIDNCDCRRVMVTTRNLWTTCTGSDCDTEKPDGANEGKDDTEPEEPIGVDAPNEAVEPAKKPATRSRRAKPS